MILRRVSDLRPGDAVRPFEDGRLWSVSARRWPGPGEEVRANRIMLIVGHPVDGLAEIEVNLDDLVKIG